MSMLLRHIHACTRHDPSGFVPFAIGAKTAGAVTHEIAAVLSGIGKTFLQNAKGLVLDESLKTYKERTGALAHASSCLSKHFGTPLRGEMYGVVEKWGEDPMAEIDRAAVPWFGTPGFGVHVNGFVRKADGLHLWIAERALDRAIDPGKLDNLIGGGMPIGHGIEETLIKEAWEEAGIDAVLAKTAKPAGSLHYKVDMMNGVRNDTLFIYDLELPETFIPRNTDGEVGSFTLMPINDVAAIVRTTDRFKFNCNLVIIDFLLRHGHIGAGHPEFSTLEKAIAGIRHEKGTR